PVWRMLHADATEIEARARRIGDALGTSHWEIVEGTTLVGGGSVPGRGVPTPLLRVPTPHANAAARRLRLGEPAIVTRVADDALVLDLRTVEPAADQTLAARLAEVVGS